MNSSKDFWLEFNKINPNSKLSSKIIGVNLSKGDKEMSDLFHDKYKLLCNSVPAH